MKKGTYLNYIEYTLDTYNKANKKALLKIFEEKNIAKKKECQINMFDDQLVSIDYSSIDESILECLKKSGKAIEEYEIFQFTRAYKYSVLFSVEDFKKLMESVKKINEYKYEEDEFALYDDLKNPSRYKCNNCTMILFNKKYEAIHPQTGDELFLHYPIVVVFHEELEVVEIRFDSVKRLFTGGDRDQTIYIKLIEDVSNYISEEFDIKLVPIKLEFLIELLKKEENEDIKLVSQYMNLATGGKAQLAVGNNENYVLPFIGELKNILNDLKDELDKNVKIKDALEQFIFEKEETTDFPWIELLFLNKEGIKTRHNHVKFTFNYMDKGYSLISYYYNDALVGMERMNDVTRFIGENFKK